MRSLDLWSLEFATGPARRLTFDTADDWDPQWTPDGVDAENPTMSLDESWIAYSSSNPAAPGIWKIHPYGSGATRVLSENFTLPKVAPGSNWIAAVGGVPAGEGLRRNRVVRLEDGAVVTELFVPDRFGNTGRGRWMADGRTLVSWGQDESLRTVLYRQLLVTSDERRRIESFGVSPVDGRVVVSAGWGERDVLRVEGIPGMGESLRARGR